MALKCPKCHRDQAVSVLTQEDGFRHTYPCRFCHYANFQFRSNATIRGDDMGLFKGRHRGKGDDHNEDYHLHECPEPGCDGSIGFRDMTDQFGHWIAQDVLPCNKCGFNQS